MSFVPTVFSVITGNLIPALTLLLGIHGPAITPTQALESPTNPGSASYGVPGWADNQPSQIEGDPI